MTGEPTLPPIDLAAEQASTGWDWGLLVLIVAAALLFLARRVIRPKSGCAACGRSGACSAVRRPDTNDAPDGSDR